VISTRQLVIERGQRDAHAKLNGHGGRSLMADDDEFVVGETVGSP